MLLQYPFFFFVAIIILLRIYLIWVVGVNYSGISGA